MEEIEIHDITDASEEEIDELLGYDRDEDNNTTGIDPTKYIRQKAEEMNARGADWESFQSRHLKNRDWVGQDEWDAAMDVYNVTPEPLPAYLEGICEKKKNSEVMSRKDEAALRGYENSFFNQRARYNNQPTL